VQPSSQRFPDDKDKRERRRKEKENLFLTPSQSYQRVYIYKREHRRVAESVFYHLMGGVWASGWLWLDRICHRVKVYSSRHVTLHSISFEFQTNDIQRHLANSTAIKSCVRSFPHTHTHTKRENSFGQEREDSRWMDLSLTFDERRLIGLLE
jgi:hypothetical protein